MSHFPVPDGEMEFDWKGLTPPATGQAVARWRGIIRHDIDHTLFDLGRRADYGSLQKDCRRPKSSGRMSRSWRPRSVRSFYDGFPSESCTENIDNVIGKVATRTVLDEFASRRRNARCARAVVKGEQATCGVSCRRRLAEPSGDRGAQRTNRRGDSRSQNPSKPQNPARAGDGRGKVSIESRLQERRRVRPSRSEDKQ